jgi:drug/metabolite transporter (DMT)-like permease
VLKPQEHRPIERRWADDRPAGIFVHMRYKDLRADAFLLQAAILWGAAFVAQRAAMSHMGPLTFTGVRFALGALAMVPIIAWFSRRPANADADADSEGRNWRPCLIGGLLAGLVLSVAVGLQQAGIVYTTAGKAGFITMFYVPLVPILGLFVGQRTSAATWLGAGLSLVGVYFLSTIGPLRIERGDGLVMMSAVVWAVQVLLIGRLAPRTDPLRLAMVQFTVVAITSLTAAGFFEQITAEGLRAGIWAILYGGIASSCIAYTLQLLGQRDAPPGHAALVFSLEAVFAALAGYCILGETFGSRELFGAAVMLGGVLVSQVNRLRSRSAPVPDQCRAHAALQACRES